MDNDSSNHGKAPLKESSTSDQSSLYPSIGPQPAPYHSSNHGKAPLKELSMSYQSSLYPSNGPQPAPYHPYPLPHGYAPYRDVPQYHHHAVKESNSFMKCFTMCSCAIFTVMFASALILVSLFRPQLPVLKVTSISVSSFNTIPILTGVWHISLTAQNPNTKVRGYFLDFRVDVVNDNNVFAMSYVPNFQLDKLELKRLDVKASSNNVVNVMSFQTWDLEKISNEQKNGSLLLDVRVSFLLRFKDSSLTTESTKMFAICEGLKILFQNNSSARMLDNEGNSVTCQLYM